MVSGGTGLKDQETEKSLSTHTCPVALSVLSITAMALLWKALDAPGTILYLSGSSRSKSLQKFLGMKLDHLCPGPNLTTFLHI